MFRLLGDGFLLIKVIPTPSVLYTRPVRVCWCLRHRCRVGVLRSADVYVPFFCGRGRLGVVAPYVFFVPVDRPISFRIVRHGVTHSFGPVYRYPLQHWRGRRPSHLPSPVPPDIRVLRVFHRFICLHIPFQNVISRLRLACNPVYCPLCCFGVTLT